MLERQRQNAANSANRDITLTDLALRQGTLSEQEAADRRFEIRRVELERRKELIKQDLANARARGKETQKLEADLAAVRSELQKNADDKITQYYDRQKKAIANTTTAVTQNLTEQINALNTLTAELGLQQKLMQSRNSLVQQSAAFAEGELANVVKATSSNQLKAMLEQYSSVKPHS